MCDRHDEIDQLGIRIERQIQRTERYLAELPDFSPRSDRSKKIRRVQRSDP